MASPDIFKSSPLREARRHAVLITSSSPDLPALNEVITRPPRKSALKSGSRAVAIPVDAPKTFTSARTLWKSARSMNKSPDDPQPIIIDEQAEDSFSNVNYQDEKDQPSNQTVQNSPKPVGGRLLIPASSDSPLSSPVRLQPWKKFKFGEETESPMQGKRVSDAREVTEDSAAAASPEVAESFTELRQEAKKLKKTTAKSKGTKQPKAARKPAKKSKKSKKGDAAEAVADEPKEPQPRAAKEPAPERSAAPKKKLKEADTDVDAGPLNLERAVARRMDWTPPKKQVPVVCLDSPEDAPESPSASVPREGFGNLLENFGCKETPAEGAVKIAGEDFVPVRKRKLLELIPAQAAATSAPAKAPVAPKKKAKKGPRTITALATAAYKAPTQPEEVDDQATLDTFCGEELQQDASLTKDEGKGKGKARKAAKPRARNSKASKKKPPPPILLSPSAAMKQVAAQDFVFGTSSQLATEHSPGFLRQLHLAMRSSNQHTAGQYNVPLNSDDVEPEEQRPKLWAAAARDADGDLFDVQVVDLATIDEELPALRAQDDVDPFGYVKADGGGGPSKSKESGATEKSDSFLDLSEILARSSSPANRGTHPHSRGAAVRASSPKALQQLVGSLASQSRNPQAGPTLTAGFSTLAPLRGATAEAHAVTGPHLSSSGVTPSVVRQNEEDPGPFHAAEPPPSAQAPVTPPKRPRGRPRKDAGSPSKAAKQAKPGRKRAVSPRPKSRATTSKAPAKRRKKDTAKEVADSASDAASSPRSASPEPTFSPAAAVDLSLSVDEDTEVSLVISPDEGQTTLFEQITKAVTTAPRTTDPSRPSWHEKILLYDPIVLEDLTEWLNAGQLAKVGYDGTVKAAEIKKWCESKSVCCLWKVNLRGKERKRY